MPDLYEFFGKLSDSERESIREAFQVLDEEQALDREPIQKQSIVSISEWLSSKLYLGSFVKSLYPAWREEIIDFFNRGYNEWIITGSLGTGKSTIAGIVCARKLYELSCYEWPQRLFGLSDISKIFFAYLSVSAKQAELTGFGDIRNFFDGSPYFYNKFQRDLWRLL